LQPSLQPDDLAVGARDTILDRTVFTHILVNVAISNTLYSLRGYATALITREDVEIECFATIMLLSKNGQIHHQLDVKPRVA
jgi:hypothetical protein